MPIIINQNRTAGINSLGSLPSTSTSFGILGDFREIKDLSILNLRVPSFIREDYPRFFDFIKAYYAWASQPNNAIGGGRKLLNELDLDSASPEYVNYFRKQYLSKFPNNISSDALLTIKFAKDIYKSKGSELGINTIFKVLYNEEPVISYPRDKVIRASSSTWSQITTIKITYTNSRTIELDGAIIHGLPSNSYAFVERSTLFYNKGIPFLELEISDLRGNFQPDDIITATLSDNTLITETVKRSIVGVSIENSGHWYVPGQSVILSDLPNSGTGFSAQVGEVTRGAIEKLKIVSSGVGYAILDKIVVNAYLKLGIQPTPTNSNHIYDYPVPSLGIGDPAATLINDNTASLGLGCYGWVKTVNGSGNITSVVLQSGGYGYQYPPILTVISVNGSGASVTVDPSPTKNTQIGKIKNILISNHGVDYSTGATLTIAANGLPGRPLEDTATITPIFGSVCEYPGAYLGNLALLSTDQAMQDGGFFQDYSYLIKSGQSIANYREVIKKLAHPAGMVFFGEVSAEPNLLEIGTDVAAGVYRNIPGEIERVAIIQGAVAGKMFRDVKLTIEDQIKASSLLTASQQILLNMHQPINNFANIRISGYINAAAILNESKISISNTVIDWNRKNKEIDNLFKFQFTSSTINRFANYTIGNFVNYPEISTVISPDATVNYYFDKQYSDSLSVADTANKTVTKAATDIATLTDTKVFTISKIAVDAITSNEALSKLLTKPISDSSTLGDAIAKLSTKSFSDSTTPISETYRFTVNKVANETVSINEAIAKSLTRQFSDFITMSEDFNSFRGRVMNDSSPLTDLITNKLVKPLGDSMTINEVVSTILLRGGGLLNSSTINSSTIG